MKTLLFAASAAALMIACSQATSETEAITEVSAAPERMVETTARDYWGDFGIDETAINTEVAPGNDFYAYVNGAWVDNFELPADRTRYGGFTILAEKSEQRVKFIIDDLAAENAPIDTLEGKIGAVYNAFMNADAIEAKGLAPAQPYLDQIAALETREDLAKIFGQVGFWSPYSAGVGQDAKSPEDNIVQIGQSRLGLPDRSYYLQDTERNLGYRAKYLDYLTFLLGEAGYENAAEAAASVIALETEIAKAHWDRALGRNRDLTYNKLSRAELVAMAGGFPIDAHLESGRIGSEQEFVVRQVTPTAEEVEKAGLSDEQLEKLGSGVQGIMEIANTAPMDQWKALLTARFLSGNASVLPQRFDEANFAFYSQELRGQQEQRERWKRAVSVTQGILGEGIGKIYVDRHFPSENKAAMDELVENLRTAMSANLDDITWMGEDTKVEARDKLAKFTPKIGHKQNFETYETLAVSADDAFANARAAAEWRYAENIAQLGQPIDKDEWFMTPQTVNAYYSPTRNEIVFPAAILQPPFFNLTADPAVNYGAIGGVIGHEMGHGFDDQGSKSDGNGVQRDWWTADDKAAFEGLTTRLVAQYNDFCPLGLDDECVNGRLTLGENIGDLGGLSMAYRAYKLSLNGEEAPVIDGFTGDQRFFMAWAQVWRSKQRDKALRQQIKTDPHSPTEFRVNGVVRNLDEWYEAFDVQPGDALYLPPEERIRIW